MKQVAEWPSFEVLRVKHADKLSLVTPGAYAVLQVKKRRFVILSAEDFAARVQHAQLLQKFVQDFGDDLTLLEGAVELFQQTAPDGQATTPQRMLGAITRRMRSTFEDMNFRLRDAGLLD